MTEPAKRDPRIPAPKGLPRKPKFNTMVDPHSVNIRLPGAWVRNLDAWCESHCITAPAFIRKAIFDAMTRLQVPTE